MEDEVNVWTLAERTPEMNVLPSTWAFKLKRFPDILAKKFEARFYVEGIDRYMELISLRLGHQ